ncbi:30S ribosome-binding factor RbfA [Flaviaesturariibacter flavus]|uniref:Ribosome-binding factor A n=1 Tax=Flaviaesturariibacter flavus TaxID=2502780 RepID=A0A4R1BBH8_9BACT|nr:30S ribosome-binding factor RbfA [Flaviaesturariibacter flavus]TCJ14333.1 30S ribosome-binding factor RbfA [Flaviaesturariibacter flavus]
MQEGKRQKQVAGLIQEEVNDIFRRLGMSMMDGGMVSVSSVKVTPDLLEARIYLSLFQVSDQKATLKKIAEREWEIKRELATRVGRQLRRMPELRFFLDDTLDYVFKMENIFDQIKKDDEELNEEKKEQGTKNKEQGTENGEGNNE